MVIYNFKKLYNFALKEGEGLGTAYEYLTKLNLLEKFVKSKNIQNVSIFGLPEKYGFSSDFIYFCLKKRYEFEIVEDRPNKITRLKKLYPKVKIIKHNLLKFRPSKKYDLLLSSEVLQRFPNFKLDRLKKISKYSIIFLPNKHNKLHNKFSKLKGVDFDKGFVREGYLDMPPFPPGIKKNNRKANLSNILLFLLRSYSRIEQITPIKIKKKLCHIKYFEVY